MGTRQNLVRALRYRNYRLFFGGQSISLIGTWLTRVASGWLVNELSHSAFILGAVSFAGLIPTFLVTPFAGVLVERWNRRRALLITQVLAMLQSGLMAALTITGRITVEWILVLSICQGLINAFDMPIRQLFLYDMIEDRADLPNAIALNSSMVNMARLVGPTFAGILIATVGEGGCFTIDSLSYLAVIASIAAMVFKPKPKAVEKARDFLADLKEGFTYASGSVPIRAVIGLLALVSLVGVPYMVLLPIIVTEQLHAGARELGYLTAASGFGALLGALYLASRGSVLGLGRIIPWTAAIFGLGLMAFSRSSSMPLSLVLMVIVGAGMMVQMAASNTLLQTVVDEDKRGRVMSLFLMAFTGMTPFGSLLGGSLAGVIGTADTVLAGGMICVVGSLVFFRALPKIRQEVRPIYVRLGILPELSKPA